MLELIESKLLEVLPTVYYSSVSEDEDITIWNYIVFRRANIKRSTNNTSFTDYYSVSIIHENWMPDELIEQVIVNMESIPGMRMANPEIALEGIRKPSTKAVVEIATMLFCRPRKRV